MPSYAPGSQTCGTRYTGWMSTPHPQVGDPPTDGVVCFDADAAGYLDCYFSEEVQVCACSYDDGATTTYSYRLPKPPKCYAGYCGTDDPLPPSLPPLPPSTPPLPAAPPPVPPSPPVAPPHVGPAPTPVVP